MSQKPRTPYTLPGGGLQREVFKKNKYQNPPRREPFPQRSSQEQEKSSGTSFDGLMWLGLARLALGNSGTTKSYE
jgi:hypothetical protein